MMTGTKVDPWVANETWVMYYGKNRSELRNEKFLITAANETAAQFDAGIYGMQWCSKDYLRVVPAPIDSPANVARYAADLDSVFTQAAGGHRAVIVSEIARLKSQLADYETALKVIDNLNA